MNVDLSHVENKVNEMLKHDRSISLLQGELISKYVSTEIQTQHTSLHAAPAAVSHRCCPGLQYCSVLSRFTLVQEHAAVCAYGVWYE